MTDLERLFQEARALPPDQRPAYLDEACDGAPRLRRQVDRLLAADDALAGDDAPFLASLDPMAATALLDSTSPDPSAVGRYQVERRLGRGGMGVVYLGRDPALDRAVALKLLPPWLSGDAHATRRLTAEARAASALDHPNIGTVFEVGATVEGRPYIAMAYYEGETLRERIARGPLPVPEALSLAAQIADGLAAAHEAGIVHRDIKPENLVIASDGRLRILDFGLARPVGAETRTGPRAAGTVAYMSPEQTRGERVDGRTDIWALGVVLYEMLTGVRPFRGDNPMAVMYGIRNETPAPAPSLRPEVPEPVASLVERCLEKDPTRRFDAPTALAAALRHAATRLDTAPAPSPLDARRVVRLGLPAAGLLAALVLARRLVDAAAAAAVIPSWTAAVAGGLFLPALFLVLLTALTQITGWRPLRTRLTWRRTGAAAAVLLALVVLGAGGHATLRSLGLGPAGTLASRGLLAGGEPVVLADFGATAADPRIGQVVTEALRIDLLQSPTVRVADRGEVLTALGRMGRDPTSGLSESAALEVAVREGFKAVLAGEVGALGGGYVLTARVVAAADGATLVAVRETAPDSAGLIAAMNRLSKRVRERMGESLAALAAADPLPRVATSSLPALRRYAEAYDLAWAGGDDARIAELLEETVALDSMFAAAYRGLATTYWNMRADRQRALAAITRAYELRDRFSDRERYLVEATYHWQVEGQSGLTRQAYRRVLAVAPEDFTSRANLGLALLFDGEPEEAERVLREGIRPNAPAIIPINLAQALYFQGRTGEALEVLDSVSPGPGGGALNPFAENMRVRVLGGDGRWAEAESVARAVLAEFDASPHVRAEAHRALWHLALTRGRLAEAEREFAAMASLFERIGSLEALARAHVQRAEARLTLLGDAPGARSALDSLLDQPDLDVLTVGATIAPRAAAALAAAGDTARAIRLIDRWEALPPGERSDPDGYSAEHVRARTALVGGRTEEAVRRLERATDRTIQAINYLPDLARAYRDAGRVADAIAAFEEYLAFRHIRRIHRVPGHLAPVLMELADLYEATGDTEAAAATYLRLVELWAGADDELRSHVERAQARASALMGRDP